MVFSKEGCPWPVCFWSISEGEKVIRCKMEERGFVCPIRRGE